MEIDERMWKFIQKHLGYSDEEMELFRADPRNAEVLMKGVELMGKRIVLEVVKSHGCNSQHREGDRFVFDGAGNLLTEENPGKVCVYAMGAAGKLIFAANELFYAGVDPNEMRFRRAGCVDVGVRCGGWGNIVMEIGVRDGN